MANQMQSKCGVQERGRRQGSKAGEVEEGSVAPAGRKTLETLGAADTISEALEMAANELQRQQVCGTEHDVITAVTW